MKRTPLKRIGKVGKKRLAASKRFRREREKAGRQSCEIASILRERGIDTGPCIGPLTAAHSLKTSARADYHGKERERLDNEVCDACERHHYFVLDLLAPQRTLDIVREAIRRRNADMG